MSHKNPKNHELIQQKNLKNQKKNLKEIRMNCFSVIQSVRRQEKGIIISLHIYGSHDLSGQSAKDKVKRPSGPSPRSWGTGDSLSSSFVYFPVSMSCFFIGFHIFLILPGTYCPQLGQYVVESTPMLPLLDYIRIVLLTMVCLFQ